MTIDEAIKDIKDNIKPVVGGISLDMAIEALEKQRWIPVSERLPDIDEDVLVSDGTWIWKDCLEVRYGKVQWYHNETLEGTAWMPLPEAYQEGGEDV